VTWRGLLPANALADGLVDFTFAGYRVPTIPSGTPRTITPREVIPICNFFSFPALPSLFIQSTSIVEHDLDLQSQEMYPHPAELHSPSIQFLVYINSIQSLVHPILHHRLLYIHCFFQRKRHNRILYSLYLLIIYL
jgi:hypothetical protein